MSQKIRIRSNHPDKNGNFYFADNVSLSLLNITTETHTVSTSDEKFYIYKKPMENKQECVMIGSLENWTIFFE